MEIHKSKVIFGALSVKTSQVVSHICQRHKGVDAVEFLEKVKRYRNENLTNAQEKILLLWDNGACHKSPEVKQWLADNPGIVELDNFPPYSPEFNPVEHVWKELKKHINYLRGTATLNEITTVAEQFLKSRQFHYKLFNFKKEYFRR